MRNLFKMITVIALLFLSSCSPWFTNDPAKFGEVEGVLKSYRFSSSDYNHIFALGVEDSDGNVFILLKRNGGFITKIQGGVLNNKIALEGDESRLIKKEVFISGRFLTLETETPKAGFLTLKLKD